MRFPLLSLMFVHIWHLFLLVICHYWAPVLHSSSVTILNEVVGQSPSLRIQCA